MQYIDASQIEVTCEYDKLVNKILKSFQTSAIIMQPRTFDDIRDERKSEMALGHFTNILCVEWLKESSLRLRKWTNIINEYITEFNGQWKYYAAAKRLDFLKEYSGDDSDYDEDGNIRTEGLSDEEYKSFTVISDLYEEGFRDIIQDAIPEDLYLFTSTISADASLDIRDMFAGQHVPIYKVDEDGTMREISFAEQEVDKAIRQVSANDTVALFTLMFYAIWYICRQLQYTLEHHPYENNVVFLRQIRRYISEISAMRLSEQLVEEVRILAQDDFNKKYKDLQEQEDEQ